MNAVKIIGIILAVLPSLFILFIMFRKNESFFNFREIIKAHLSLFSSCKSQYFSFYFLPVPISIGLSMLFFANAEFYSHLGVVLSIVLSMLLAILAILSEFDFSKFEDEMQRSMAEKAVKQTINAILFCCIIGIVLLLFGFLVIAINGKTNELIPIDNNICKTIFSAISYYLLIVILLNLLLIVKNLCKIIEAKISIEKNSNTK